MNNFVSRQRLCNTCLCVAFQHNKREKEVIAKYRVYYHLKEKIPAIRLYSCQASLLY